MKAMLWGAAAAIVLDRRRPLQMSWSSSRWGRRRRPIRRARPCPKARRSRLQGGDVVTVIGPSSAQTLRGPGNFDAKQVALASAAGQRGRFGALRASEVAHNPSIWDVDVSAGGKVCVSDASKLQLWRPDSETEMKVTIRNRGRESAGAELGRRQGADRVAGAHADQERRVLSGRMAGHGRQEQPRRRDRLRIRRPTSSARRRCCSRTAARSSSTCSSKARARRPNSSSRPPLRPSAARLRRRQGRGPQEPLRMLAKPRRRQVRVRAFAIEAHRRSDQRHAGDACAPSGDAAPERRPAPG